MKRVPVVAHLTVGQLKEILYDVDDRLIVVQPAWDHGYGALTTHEAGVVNAERFAEPETGREFAEYHDDANMSEGSTKIKVFLLGGG